jgi:hypothetical protein
MKRLPGLLLAAIGAAILIVAVAATSGYGSGSGW